LSIIQLMAVSCTCCFRRSGVALTTARFASGDDERANSKVSDVRAGRFLEFGVGQVPLLPSLETRGDTELGWSLAWWVLVVATVLWM
jgi:hypothetical protein